MKRIAILAIALVGLSFFTSAQSFKNQKKIKFDHKQVFLIDPIKVISNTLSIGYEKMLEQNTSIKIIGNYKKYRTNDFTGLENFNSLNLETQFRFYVGGKKKVYNGFYIGPFAQFKKASFDYMDFTSSWGRSFWRNGNAQSIYVGYVAGYHVPASSDFTIDIYLQHGMNASTGDISYASQPFDQYSNSVRMSLGINVGLGL